MNNVLPEVLTSYYHFDDGKIRLSRRYVSTIIDIKKPEEVSHDLLRDWKSEVKECYWLYAKETDYFIEAELVSDINDEFVENVVYVRTVHGEWFSLGIYGGILDTDGSLNTIAMSKRNNL